MRRFMFMGDFLCIFVYFWSLFSVRVEMLFEIARVYVKFVPKRKDSSRVYGRL